MYCDALVREHTVSSLILRFRILFAVMNVQKHLLEESAKATRSIIVIAMLITEQGKVESVRTELEWRIAGVLLLAMLQKPGAANVLLLLLQLM